MTQHPTHFILTVKRSVIYHPVVSRTIIGRVRYKQLSRRRKSLLLSRSAYMSYKGAHCYGSYDGIDPAYAQLKRKIKEFASCVGISVCSDSDVLRHHHHKLLCELLSTLVLIRNFFLKVRLLFLPLPLLLLPRFRCRL